MSSISTKIKLAKIVNNYAKIKNKLLFEFQVEEGQSLWAASACNDDHYCVLIDAKLFLCYQGLLWITAKLQFPGSSLASAD